MSLRIVPVTRDQAVDFIRQTHRHHGRPQGYRFAVGVAVDDQLVGVATVGRPVARLLDDGLTVEVTRVSTDGHPNACSALYGTCWRAARALGYVHAITYTQEGEGGASLRAAGWLVESRRGPRAGWDTPARGREAQGTEGVARIRWGIRAGVAA
jgi:hypothetical protein